MKLQVKMYQKNDNRKDNVKTEDGIKNLDKNFMMAGHTSAVCRLAYISGA